MRLFMRCAPKFCNRKLLNFPGQYIKSLVFIATVENIVSKTSKTETYGFSKFILENYCKFFIDVLNVQKSSHFQNEK